MEESSKITDDLGQNQLQNEFDGLLQKAVTLPSKELFESCAQLHSRLLETKFYGLISKNLSLMGLLKYKINPADYKISLNMLEDSHFLAQTAQDMSALKMNCFCRGVVFENEKNYSEALINLTKAKFIHDENFFLDSKIEGLLKSVETYKDICSQTQDDGKKPLVALLNVARTLAAQTGLDMVLDTIAREIKKVLNADRCSVFLLDKETNELWSKVALGITSKELRFSADKGLAGYVAKTGEIINIENAYDDPRFNREVDSETGYKTKTILCMPMRNMKHEILGVFQVLNKIGGTFTKEDEELLVAIGSSAGIAIENARLFDFQQKMIEQQKELFKSFIDTLSASIDARDKITAGHSNRVKMYSELICDVLGLEKSKKELIIHAAILHDIGKIGIRDSVLQKEGKLTDEEYKHIQEHVKITSEILNRVYLSEEFKEVAQIASSHHEKYDGTGYFRKLSGEGICLGGRILAVSDVFDAITSKRHYRDKMPVKDALGIIKSGAGKHFDPSIAEAFFNIRTDNLVKVFMSESGMCFKPEDEDYLSGFFVRDLWNLVTTKEICDFEPAEKKFFDIFNYYYNCKAGN